MKEYLQILRGTQTRRNQNGNMYFLPLQWERGNTNSIGERKLVFSADKSIDLGDFNPFKIEQGTQYMVILVETNSEEFKEFQQETKEETTERFRKHMNALINKVADFRGESPVSYREKLKQMLRSNGVIKDSTKELTIEGYSRVINYLTRQIHERN